jgi:DNA-binding transcriptional ArsR family regulator
VSGAAGEERRRATDAGARALASAVRLRILRLCRDTALTDKELAARLDRNPATVLHHVRTLLQTGFLAAEPERRGPRGAREVPYRATGKSWQMDDAGGPGPRHSAPSWRRSPRWGSAGWRAPGWRCG